MKIIIVEDDQRVSDFLQRGLTEEGFNVTVTRNGHSALEFCELYNFDLMILDLMIPGINGIDVCKTLRNNGNSMSIIMLTARDALDSRLQGFNAGADDYISKPFAFEELLARIRAILRRNQQKLQNEIIKVGVIELDIYRHKVSVNGKNIDLTSKEFRLLEFLIRNKGRVLSHALILQDVWEIDSYPDTNIIDVYIHRLRKKLGFGKENTYIRTIRGSGYLLSDQL